MMKHDAALEYLKSIAARADKNGVVQLQSHEIPFSMTAEGTRWLEQVGDGRYQISDHGRQILGLPRH